MKTQCDCPDYAPELEKINGPIALQQIRSGQPAGPDYFKPWAYCPWCGSDLTEAVDASAPPAPQATPTPAMRAMARASWESIKDMPVYDPDHGVETLAERRKRVYGV